MHLCSVGNHFHFVHLHACTTQSTWPVSAEFSKVLWLPRVRFDFTSVLSDAAGLELMRTRLAYPGCEVRWL